MFVLRLMKSRCFYTNMLLGLLLLNCFWILRACKLVSISSTIKKISCCFVTLRKFICLVGNRLAFQIISLVYCYSSIWWNLKFQLARLTIVRNLKFVLKILLISSNQWFNHFGVHIILFTFALRHVCVLPSITNEKLVRFWISTIFYILYTFSPMDAFSTL